MIMNRVTISDVAVAAGVSMKSVSRVINGEPNVTPRLAEKVESAIAALGYVPDLAARSLASGRSFTIGILYDNPSPNYTMKLQAGAYRACRAHGYHLLIEHVDTSRDDVAEQLRGVLLNARLDGFILTPPVCDSDAALTVLEERGVPYVRVSPAAFPGRSPSVAIDEVAAARDLTEHLVALGHSKIGIINGPEQHLAAIARRQGVVDVVREHDLPAPVEAYGGFEFVTGIKAGLELLSSNDRPTAIFAGNDDAAAGVMAAAAQLGLKVPDDVAIAGFDDSWIALTVWPSLTTIHQPIEDLAKMAVNVLLDRKGAMKSAGNILLDYHMVIRGSTGVAK
jgi:LacI family transcriptional regulator